MELGGNSQAFDPQPLAAHGDLLGLQQRRRGGNRPLGRLEGNLPFRGERVEVELWLDETEPRRCLVRVERGCRDRHPELSLLEDSRARGRVTSGATLRGVRVFP